MKSAPIFLESEDKRDNMIAHAIRRAWERHGYDLSVADIEYLNAQYRTDRLRVVAEPKLITFTKDFHGKQHRTFCWAAQYGCYVVFDEGVRTVVTFLPHDWSPEQARDEVRMVPRARAATIQTKAGQKIPKALPQKLKKQKQPKAPVSDQTANAMKAARNAAIEPDRKQKKIMALVREQIASWYCERLNIQPEIPGRGVVHLRTFYSQRNAWIAEELMRWFEIDDLPSEMGEWLVARAGYVVREDGSIWRQDGGFVNHSRAAVYEHWDRKYSMRPGRPGRRTDDETE